MTMPLDDIKAMLDEIRAAREGCEAAERCISEIYGAATSHLSSREALRHIRTLIETHDEATDA